MGSLFDPEQLVGPGCHLIHFKGAMVFFESEILLCLHDFRVTPPHSLATVTNPPICASVQRHTLLMLQEAHTFFQNFLQADLTAVSTVSEHVRQSLVADLGPDLAALSHELLPEFDPSPPWSASSSLTSTTESISQSLVLPEASTATPIIGVSGILDWTGGKIDEMRLTSVKAMANCQHCFVAPGFGLGSVTKLRLSRGSAVPTADIGFLSPGMGPLAALIIKCAVRGVVLLLVLGNDGECKEWVPNRGASSWDVLCGENWRTQSAS